MLYGVVLFLSSIIDNYQMLIILVDLFQLN